MKHNSLVTPRRIQYVTSKVEYYLVGTYDNLIIICNFYKITIHIRSFKTLHSLSLTTLTLPHEKVA